MKNALLIVLSALLGATLAWYSLLYSLNLPSYFPLHRTAFLGVVTAFFLAAGTTLRGESSPKAIAVPWCCGTGVAFAFLGWLLLSYVQSASSFDSLD
ncbi:hypothetical protein MHT86_02640 [Corynebacterium mastitidis]|uniref:Uncharacterized protein n=1 Tax=Corynebacterium mastitidis TaxID=161890 RepID=A0A2N0X5K2_9CORY|nr:hypothetical protein [Corynebacterium mastitidis]MCH6196398.1 hypothetical protein [Corynebacterium mastitidis]PKF67984.1 hypothetical protein CXB45_09465 [Corynebacterium mastitidis]